MKSCNRCQQCNGKRWKHKRDLHWHFSKIQAVHSKLLFHRHTPSSPPQWFFYVFVQRRAHWWSRHASSFTLCFLRYLLHTKDSFKPCTAACNVHARVNWERSVVDETPSCMYDNDVHHLFAFFIWVSVSHFLSVCLFECVCVCVSVAIYECWNCVDHFYFRRIRLNTVDTIFYCMKFRNVQFSMETLKYSCQ